MQTVASSSASAMDGAAALGGEGGGGGFAFLGRAMGEREREKGGGEARCRAEKGKRGKDRGARPCDSDSLRIGGGGTATECSRLLCSLPFRADDLLLRTNLKAWRRDFFYKVLSCYGMYAKHGHVWIIY